MDPAKVTLTARSPSNCSVAPASILSTPIADAVSAISSLPPATSTVPPSASAPETGRAMVLNFRAASELETVPAASFSAMDDPS